MSSLSSPASNFLHHHHHQHHHHSQHWLSCFALCPQYCHPALKPPSDASANSAKPACLQNPEILETFVFSFRTNSSLSAEEVFVPGWTEGGGTWSNQLSSTPHVMFQTESEQWKSQGRENTEKPRIVLIQSNDGRLQQFRFVGSAEISGHLSLNGFLYYIAWGGYHIFSRKWKILKMTQNKPKKNQRKIYADNKSVC